MFDAYCKAPDLSEAKVSTAVLPVGSIEQHSLHLPVGTDWILAEEVGRRVAAQLDAYALPALPFSTSVEHSHFCGTVWLRPSTFAQVVSDIALSLHSQGISRIAVITWHGGNWTLKPTVRELNLSNPGLHVIWAVPYDLAYREMKVIFPHYDEDIHAGDFETSCLLYLMKDVVGDNRVDYVPPIGREFLDYVSFRKFSPNGVWGRPSLATAEKGEKALRLVVDATSRYIRESLDKVEEFDAVQSARP